MLRPGLVLIALCGLQACSDDTITPVDAGRFDPRDAVVAPRPDAAGDVGTAADAGAQVDVIAFDVPASMEDAGMDAADGPVTCDLLSARYAQNAHDAQACSTGSDCTMLVCETPCCACLVYVQPGTAAYLRLADLRSRWAAMGCATTAGCPRIPCDRPVSAACSSEGRCVTLRAPGDGGL